MHQAVAHPRGYGAGLMLHNHAGVESAAELQKRGGVVAAGELEDAGRVVAGGNLGRGLRVRQADLGGQAEVAGDPPAVVVP